MRAVTVDETTFPQLEEFAREHATDAHHTRLDADAITSGRAPSALLLDGDTTRGAVILDERADGEGRRMRFLHALDPDELPAVIGWARQAAGAPKLTVRYDAGSDAIASLERLGAVRHSSEYYLERDALSPDEGELRVNGVTIEPLATDQHDEFVALWRDAEADEGRRTTITPANISDDLAGDEPVVYLQANADARLVGTARADIWDGTGWFGCLAVAPDMRRRGIARALLRRLGRWATDAGATRISLAVEAENPSALALYLSEGYEVLEESVLLVL